MSMTPIPIGNDVPVSSSFQTNLPTVAALGDGGFVATWMSSSQDGDGWGIYRRRYAADGSAVGSELRINTFFASDQQFPCVTTLLDGGFVVTWSSFGQDGSGYGIYGQRYAADGSTVGGEFKINTFVGLDQVDASVTALSDGGFVVTWMSSGQDGDGFGIYGQRYAADGSAASGEFQVNTFFVGIQGDASVTALSDGGFVVTWSSLGQDGSGYGVYGQRYAAAGTATGSEFQVNTFVSNDQFGTSATSLADGGFVVTWSSLDQDGSGTGIYGQRYAADASRVGGEFHINTYNSGSQQNTSVASLSDGGFVVTWSSFDQDTFGWGVYGQRYAANGAPLGEEFRINANFVGSQLSQTAYAVAELSDGHLVQVMNGADGRVWFRLIEIPVSGVSEPTIDRIGAGGAIGGSDDTVSSQSGDATVVGTADPDAAVTLKFGATVLGTTSADAGGNWTYTLTSENQAVIGQGSGKAMTAVASNASGNTSAETTSAPFAVDTIAPVPVLAVGPITADNVINANEAGSSVLVTGTVSGEFSAGDTVSLTVNGVVSTGKVDAAGVFSLSVQGSDLVADSDHSVSGSITTIDSVGNSGAATAGKGYGVDTVAPVVSINPLSGDGFIGIADLGLHLTISGATAGVEDGQLITITFGGGSWTATVSSNGWARQFSAAQVSVMLPTDGIYDVTANVSDRAGNAAAEAARSVIVDRTAPLPVLTIGSITADNVLNATEAGGTVLVAGTVSGEFMVGDTVSLTVNDVVSTGQVSAGGAFSISVQGTDLVADGDHSVSAGITTSDAAGNVGTATASKAYGVDVAPPVPVLVIGSITADNAVNASEASATVQVVGTVSGEFLAGDTVLLTVNGVVSTGQVSVGGAFSIAVQGSDLVADADHSVAASITTTDAAGNAGTTAAAKAYGVDTAPPVPVLVIGSITADNVVNAAEAGGAVLVSGMVSGEFKAGDTVSLTVNSVVSTGQVNAGGAFSIAVQGSDLAADADHSVAGSITTIDAAGNAGTATAGKAYGVDAALPVPVLVIGSITADNVVNAAEAGGAVQVSGTVSGEFKAGDTVSLTVNGVVSTGQVDAAGAFSIAVQGSDLVADADHSVAGSITTTDAAGNVGTASQARSYGLASLISLAPPALVAPEGNQGSTSFTFAVVLDAPSGTAQTVAWSVAGIGSHAADVADFGGAWPGGTIELAAGETSKSVTVLVAADSVVEFDETFEITLSGLSAGLDLGFATAQGTIQNDDRSVVSIAALSADKTEGSGGGTTTYTFTVSLDQAGVTDQTVAWSVAGSGVNATSGADFGGPTSGMLTFAAGETSKTLSIAVSADGAVEHDEGFTVSLSAPSAGLLAGTTTAQGAIVNDDRSPVSILALSAARPEGQAGVTAYSFLVQLHQAGVTAQSVDWAVAGSGTNLADAADFGGILPSGTVTFAAGDTLATVTVLVSGDTLVEADEGFTVALSGLSDGLVPATGSAAGIIVDDDRAVVSIAALVAVRAEGDIGTTDFTFMVSLDQAALTDQTVSWSVMGAGPTPADGADFAGALASGTVVFAAGETSHVVTLHVSGDTAAETDEGFTVSLSKATAGLALGTAVVQGTILNDDGSVVSIAALEAVRLEGAAGGTSFTFTVGLDQAATGTRTVDWTVAGIGGFAADAADFGGALPGGTVTFAAGESSKTVTVQVSGDTTVEPDESYEVVLSIESAGLVLGTAVAHGVILNDDAPVVSIAALSADKAEGTVGGTAFTFTVSLDRIAVTSQSVNWAVAGIGAEAADAADFGGALTGTVMFLAGETTRTVTVLVSGDARVERDEGFALTLSGSSAGLVLGTASAQGTIRNDDQSVVSIAALSAVAAEGDGGATSFTFMVSLDQADVATRTVDWSVVGSGARPADAADFGGALPGGTVTFAPGETSRVITVTVSGDTAVEPDEGFIVTLANPSAGLALGASSASGTILNDDRSVVSVAALTSAAAEGDAGMTAFTFVISLDQASLASRSVQWSVAGTGVHAADAFDFGGVLPSGTVTFAAGETSKVVTVLVGADLAVEHDESFGLTLSGASEGLVLGTATAGAAIVNDDRAVVSIAAVSADKPEGAAGATAFTFLVSLDRPGVTDQMVGWSVSGSGLHAADGADFTGPLSGTVTFAPGEVSQVVSVLVGGDSTIEFEEGFSVTLSDPSVGLSIGTAAAQGTIRNDDGATVSIAALSADLIEGNDGTTIFSFTVSLGQAGVIPQTVAWSVTGSGADAADVADFGGALPSGEVTFAAGETSKVVTVTVRADAIVERDETFTVALSDPSAGLVLGTSTAQGTIRNDDRPVVSIAAASADKPEGSGATTPFSFTITLDQAATSMQAVDWSVVGGTGPVAADAADFGGALPSGSVTFAAGETIKTVTVDVNGDTTPELDETFSVVLSAVSAGLALGVGSADATVRNDDRSVVSIAALSAVHPEGNGGETAFTFTVTLDRAGVTSQTVDWSVAGSGVNAAGASDFSGPLAGALTFAAGETSRTITVLVAGDGDVEADETFTVTLSNASVGLVVGSVSAMGTIGNDDAPVVSIAPLSTSKPEGNSGTTAFTFVVSLDRAALTNLAVDWSAAGVGAQAAEGSDFATPAAGRVTFAAGETSRTIVVEVAGDGAVEADEGFTVTLSNPATGLVLGAAVAGGTIVNDDASVSIAASAAAQLEGDAGVSGFTFVLTLTGDSSVARQVAWSVSGTGAGPADAADFVGGMLPAGIATFAAGETVRTIVVGVAADDAAEVGEGFTVTLSNPSTGLAIGLASATVTIVNDDIEANDDTYVAIAGQALQVAASAGVLLNDGATVPATASVLSAPAHGTLSLGSDGQFTYTPAAGFAGLDTFTYRATIDNGADDAEVSILVTPLTVGATATLDLLALTAEQQIAATYAAFFGRAADADGFEFWVGEFAHNLPTHGPSALFADIASSFAISDEAEALHPFLADPFGASDAEIAAFLNGVYDSLFNRASDSAGLAYWTDQVKQTLQAGEFVGSILVDIVGGAQNSVADQDITTLMGKIAVSLAYVQEQQEHDMVWAGASDIAAATALLEAVTADPASVLAGIRNAEGLVAGHA